MPQTHTRSHITRRRPVNAACVTAMLALLLAGCATRHGAGRTDAEAARVLGAHTGGMVVELIVPSVDRDGAPIAAERLRGAVSRTEAELARVFGGYTTHTGTRGGWLDEQGRVQAEEHAAIVRTYGGGDGEKEALSAVRGLAASLARDLNQHCVTVVVNGRMYLVPPTAR